MCRQSVIVDLGPAIITMRNTMERVAVVGSGGAGKTTFSAELGLRTGLPVIHLDQLYWSPAWVKMPSKEWETLQDG